MSYASTRDDEQLRILDIAIAEFVHRYNSRPPSTKRRTLFLFPGGLASQLLRARKRYRDDLTTPQTFQYDKIWLTLGTFLGDALHLKMKRDAQGVFRDDRNRIVIADGAVELFGISPYHQFTEWCEAQDLDWFVFGWDWRRRLEETVEFFVARFLLHFQSVVAPQIGNVDPLKDFVLVGHSFGGMVVKLILHRPEAVLGGLTRAVTVASPFYGYGGQIHRWFEGEPYFNALGKKEVIRTISSLPGCYTLAYLDGQTFNTNNAALTGDPNFPLPGYPSRDAANSSQIADPYNPAPKRYPTNSGFDNGELTHAQPIYKQVAADLPPALAAKFYNIRGVHLPPNDTVGGITWASLAPGYDPATDPTPIQDGGTVPGDDTQPAWSARLVTLPSSHCLTVGGGIHHMFMMEYPQTHQALAAVL
jgi:hypothetical protein